MRCMFHYHLCVRDREKQDRQDVLSLQQRRYQSFAISTVETTSHRQSRYLGSTSRNAAVEQTSNLYSFSTSLVTTCGLTVPCIPPWNRFGFPIICPRVLASKRDHSDNDLSQRYTRTPGWGTSCNLKSTKPSAVPKEGNALDPAWS